MSTTPANSLWDWFDRRLGLDVVSKLAREKEVPVHRHTVWYYFGGMTLFLFTIQVVTGILLLLYYRPSAENAFESVQFIMAEVRFGWLIRSIHSWSANVLIAVLFIHLFSVFFLRAYRKPRELTWISGVLLFFITLAFGFSGYLLPWNTVSFFATKVGTEVAGVVPLVGHFLVRFLRGGDEVTGATLTRFFGFHVAILPAACMGIVGIHLLLVQRHGMSVPSQPGKNRFEVDEVHAEFSASRFDGMADGSGSPRCPCGAVPVGTRSKSGSVRAGARRHPA